ncbi:MAG: 3',5'-cyclic-nucleotide phosphodiesterase [Oligoflexia bacterium]|nr:3',5'-cyclic-nucleotide phosphodiesterase [Oligoflexia bacterium]
MQVKIIGGHGGVSPGFKNTSYLIDGKLLIDAGSVASGLQIDDQVLIDHILISHSHLDHISDLAFLADNCFGLKGKPFEVYTSKVVENSIMKHLLNDEIWPNFTVIPNKEDPTLRFNIVESNETITLGEYKITMIPVNHPAGGHGFIVEKGDTGIVFTQDTGPTDKIWEEAKKLKNLKAIFTEVSFPNSMQVVADLSFHHTPKTIEEEIKKMPDVVPIFLGHIKPNYQAQMYQEISDMGNDRVTLLGSDNTCYVF